MKTVSSLGLLQNLEIYWVTYLLDHLLPKQLHQEKRYPFMLTQTQNPETSIILWLESCSLSRQNFWAEVEQFDAVYPIYLKDAVWMCLIFSLPSLVLALLVNTKSVYFVVCITRRDILIKYKGLGSGGRIMTSVIMRFSRAWPPKIVCNYL